MLRQIRIMTKLELCNLYGWNTIRFSKDKKTKRRNLLLLIAWIFVIAILCVYVGLFSYGVCSIGLQEVVPAYLIAVSSLLIFFFGIFKAGSYIFRRNGYEMLCALPLLQTAVVTSRFLRIYVEELLLALAVMVPGLAVYCWHERPGTVFYFAGLIGTLAIPVLPTAGAIVLGTLVTAIASRMKHKSLASSVLTLVSVFAIMFFSSKLSLLEGNITLELLRGISQFLFSILEKIYPPAVWIGRAMIKGELLKSLGYTGLFLVIFAGVILLVSAIFQSVCRGLYSTSAKHDYQMKKLKRNSVKMSLCKREFKRYFSSSVYVTNTITGPIMGTVLSAALFVVGEKKLQMLMMLPFDIFVFVPFILAGVFCLMTTTSVSVSMEGKNWWIVKSLPLSTRDILDAKILMNLILMLPFYLISQVLLILALKPQGLEIVWLVVIPAVLILFSCVFGITVNLRFLVVDWENEAAVVKQSAAAMLGGFCGFLLAVVFALAVGFLPGDFENLINAAGCVLILLLTACFYRKNNRTDLEKL